MYPLNEKGVSVIEWDTSILPLLTPDKQGATAVVPYRHYRSHPMIPSSASPWSGKRRVTSKDHRSTGLPCFAEINCVAVDGDFMYGASGDTFGCYKWDLATGHIVATYHHMYCVAALKGVPGIFGRKNYFHTVEVVIGTSVLLTGGEDGVLGIWNTDTNQLVDVMNLNPLVHSTIVAQDVNAQRRANKNSQNDEDSVCWISSCLARDEQWWIVAGGLHICDCVSRGYVATIHGPTRTIRSIALTPGIIQQVALYPKLSQGPQRVVAVANTHHVLYWDNLFQLHNGPSQSVWCHAPSIFAIAAEQSDRPRVALGGVGSVVDVLEDGSRYSQQLRTD
jgi:WD40 repeat protein